MYQCIVFFYIAVINEMSHKIKRFTALKSVFALFISIFFQMNNLCIFMNIILLNNVLMNVDSCLFLLISLCRGERLL